MKTKYYTPAQKEIQNYGFGEKIDVRLETKVIIETLTDRIYKTPYSAVRELYNNEVTAIEKALQINPHLRPKIVIRFDSSTREFSIKGIDSFGMTRETLKEILAVLGRSGNNDSSSKGLFGMGFFSFVKLSERCIITSWSLENDEKWAYICKSAIDFEPLPKGSYDELTSTGFEVKVTLKDSINEIRVLNVIRDISLLSGFETSYEVDGVEMEIIQYENLEKYFKNEYKDYFKDNKTCGYSLFYEHIKTKDVEIIVGRQKKNLEYYNSGIRKTFLLGTPIDYNTHLGDFCYINIKNERTFKPTPDRERLTEESEDKLNVILDEIDIDGKLERKLGHCKNIEEYYESELRYFHYKIGNIDLSHDVKSLEYKVRGRRKFESLRMHLPIIKPDGFIISPTFRPKKFENYADEKILCLATNSDLNEFVKIGFKDIDGGVKRKIAKKEYKPKFNYSFKYWCSYERNDENPTPHKLIFKHDNPKDNTYYISNDMFYLVTPSAYEPRAQLLNKENLERMLTSSCLFMTNKGLMDLKDIMKRLKKKRYVGILTGEHNLRYIINNYKKNSLLIIDHHLTHRQQLLLSLLKTYVKLEPKYTFDRNMGDPESWENLLKEEIIDEDLAYILKDQTINSSINREDYFRFRSLQQKLGAKT